MLQDIHVLLIEDDPYARDLMTLLLTRDWRTRVVGEVADDQDLLHFLSDNMTPVDVVVLDTEIPWDPEWLYMVIDKIRSQENPPLILYLGTVPNVELLKYIVNDREFGGYALKSELLYTLATGIARVANGEHIVTSGINRAALVNRIPLPEDTLILDGTKVMMDFSARESEIVRLGILLNLTHRDVADELTVTPKWVAEVVSNAYGKLGMREIVSGEISLQDYTDDPTIISRWHSVLCPQHNGKNTNGNGRKPPWISTLAYHLLTIPEVAEA